MTDKGGDRRREVTITNKLGKAAWEVPDGLWRKVGLLRRIRLRRTVEIHILPVLQKLEGLYLRDSLGAKPRLVGKSLKEIETDDVAIEAGLYLLDLAMTEGLIAIEAVSSKGKKKAVTSETVPVGCCAYTVQDAKAHYLDLGAKLILTKAGWDLGKRKDQLDDVEVDVVDSLAKMRTLVQFDLLSVRELHKGLKGKTNPVFGGDADYLTVLAKCEPNQFLRGLRHALGDNFGRILKWSLEFARAVSERLGHSAKIMALGTSLLEIEDAEIIRAFGTWRMEEEKPKAGEPANPKRKKYTTFISTVKKAMGSDFNKLLTAAPELVEAVGKWNLEQIELMQVYLPYLSGEVLEILTPLAFKEKVGLLDGFYEILGRDFVSEAMITEEGVQVVRDCVQNLEEMKGRGSMPKDIKVTLAGGLFDVHLKPFL